MSDTCKTMTAVCAQESGGNLRPVAHFSKVMLVPMHRYRNGGFPFGPKATVIAITPTSILADSSDQWIHASRVKLARVATTTSTVRSVENVTGTVGKSVYLTVKLDLPAQRQVTWKVNSSTQIVTAVTGGSPVYFGDYGGRCTLYENTTLRLDNLTPTDTGEYTLTVANTGTGATQSGSVYLTVNSPLTPPTLRVNVSTTNGNAYPVNGTIVSLHCDAGGQNVVNYTFSQDGVTACSQPHVTCDKDFLYFQPIMMSDTGRYTCKIENPISSNTSQPLSLTVIEFIL
eukprot:XP_017951213.1 PREDICTED: carcinoembryonic antigen-related cell adhesion molecule 2-like [Xenopus tropicalis]